MAQYLGHSSIKVRHHSFSYHLCVHNVECAFTFVSGPYCNSFYSRAWRAIFGVGFEMLLVEPVLSSRMTSLLQSGFSVGGWRAAPGGRLFFLGRIEEPLLTNPSSRELRLVPTPQPWQGCLCGMADWAFPGTWIQGLSGWGSAWPWGWREVSSVHLEQRDWRLNCPNLLFPAWALFSNEVHPILPICVYLDSIGKGAHPITSAITCEK